MTTALLPKHSNVKSFYDKAHVITTKKGYQLLSYSTIVAQVSSDGTVIINGEYSKTTMRHIREFLQQFAPGFDTSLKNIRSVIK